MRTEGRTDMTKVLGVFRDFAKVPIRSIRILPDYQVLLRPRKQHRHVFSPLLPSFLSPNSFWWLWVEWNFCKENVRIINGLCESDN
jgi:hypothetical protein